MRNDSSFVGRTVEYSKAFQNKALQTLGSTEAADESHLYGVEWHLSNASYLHLYPVVYKSKKHGDVRVIKTLQFFDSPATSIYFSINHNGTIVTVHDFRCDPIT